MKNQELPADIVRLLEELDAPPELHKHLHVVHSAAAELLESIRKEWPELKTDNQLVLWGAAIHDIGKVLHPNELSEPGDQHLEAGYHLLLEKGFPTKLAQIALVHEHWNHPDRSLEELLVSLSDLIWNGIRNNELEEIIIGRIAEKTHAGFWDVYLRMDPILEKAAGA